MEENAAKKVMTFLTAMTILASILILVIGFYGQSAKASAKGIEEFYGPYVDETQQESEVPKTADEIMIAKYRNHEWTGEKTAFDGKTYLIDCTGAMYAQIDPDQPTPCLGYPDIPDDIEVNPNHSTYHFESGGIVLLNNYEELVCCDHGEVISRYRLAGKMKRIIDETHILKTFGEFVVIKQGQYLEIYRFNKNGRVSVTSVEDAIDIHIDRNKRKMYISNSDRKNYYIGQDGIMTTISSHYIKFPFSSPTTTERILERFPGDKWGENYYCLVANDDDESYSMYYKYDHGKKSRLVADNVIDAEATSKYCYYITTSKELFEETIANGKTKKISTNNSIAFAKINGDIYVITDENTATIRDLCGWNYLYY